MNASTIPTPYFRTVTHGRRAIDMAVLAGLFIIALLGFQYVYGGIQYLLTGVMALVFASLIALIGARWRWGPLRTVPLVLLVYFLFGTVFAAPTHARWGMVPTLASLGELLRAPVTSWKSALTISPPVGAAQGVLVVVWISMLLLALAAMTIVLRTRFYVLAWMFPFVLMGVSIAFGTSEAYQPVVRGVLFAVISVAWLTWRFESARLHSAQSTIISDSVRPGSWRNPVLRRRVIGGAVIMSIAVGAAFAAQPLLGPSPGSARYALRDQIAPPFDPNEYVSPLSEFRGYLKNQRDEELFTLTGMSSGEYVRLATLDRYDLHVYNVASSRERSGPSGAFLRTAGGVDLHQGSGSQRTSTVTIGSYSGVWMPTLGVRTNRIDLDDRSDARAGAMAENLYLNQQAQTAVHAGGLRSGDTYELSYEPYTEPGVEEQRTARFADIELPAADGIDSEVKQLAEEWVGGAETDFEKFHRLSQAIKADAHFSHGLEDDAASLSGHGAGRLLAMLEDVSFDEDRADAAPQGRIGDQEQYAALTAVMARSVDIPARVAMGFEVPEGQDGTVAITGEDVTAWVEVAFEDLGWVRFYPAPEDDDPPTQPKPKEVENPLPQVAQPPPPPAEPPSPPPGALSDDVQKDDEDLDDSVSWLVYAGLGVLPFLLVAGVLTTIVIAKSRRRTRRRTVGVLPDRVDGGWQELLDQMTDLGRPPDPVLTRQEIGAVLDGELPAMGALALASRADRAVFGPDDLPPEAVEEYWAQVMSARRSMTAAVPWHKRWLALFSLRSFRREGAQRRAETRRSRANHRARARAQRRTEALRRRRSSPRTMAHKPSRKGPSS